MAFIMEIKNCIPKDVAKAAPILHVIGQDDICIENYRGILEYENNLLRIRTNIGEIRICGHQLQISYYTDIEMKIYGEICSIEYLTCKSSRSR